MILHILAQGMTKETFSKLRMKDIYSEAPSAVTNLTTTEIFVAFAVISGMISLVSSFYRAASIGGLKVVWTTVPLWFYIGAIWILFTFTDWAWINPGYAVMILFPAYSLINSKQIVCNFTKMKMELIPTIFFMFLLFPINRFAIRFVPALEPYTPGLDFA